MELIFEKTSPGRSGIKLPRSDVEVTATVPQSLLRKEDALFPEVSELDVVRHFTRLSQRNFSVDANLYPLGSCTMKYNPRFTEWLAALPGFADLHPLLAQFKNSEQFVQGALEVLYETQRLLCGITGMADFTMQPLAGAHGELTGVMMIAAYHHARGNNKDILIIPDSAHGTNPASAAIAGYRTVSIPSDSKGVMDLDKLKAQVNDRVAGLMLTGPNTLGLFNPNIKQISDLIHSVDGLMYYDGANLNAVLGRCRPGDVGFDCVHVNLHKTFATPHGGGGPGAGPVGVNEKLAAFLPVSRVEKQADGAYTLNYAHQDSIGYIASFYGNFSVILKAYAYLLLLGKEGLKQTADHAVVNANYVRSRLKGHFDIAHDRVCMHECVFSAARQAGNGVHALDIAKFLIDKGFHPPTVYFPLIVKEAMMIEPTETESKQEMDRFIDAMIEASRLAESDPQRLLSCPRTMPISRPDEVKAARELKTNYFDPPESP